MFTWLRQYRYTAGMVERTKKVTANLPAELLAQAQATTGLGITETLIAGLRELERTKNVLRYVRCVAVFVSHWSWRPAGGDADRHFGLDRVLPRPTFGGSGG